MCDRSLDGTAHIHLAHEAILVHTLALVALGLLGPHILHVLQHHVAVSVKGLDTGQELAVVPARDQDLGVGAGGGLQERQRAGGELVLLDESDLIFPDARDARLVFFPFMFHVRLPRMHWNVMEGDCRSGRTKCPGQLPRTCSIQADTKRETGMGNVIMERSGN